MTEYEWINIGRNPYGNNVQENSQGYRRVEISGGWAYEGKANIELIKLCRATDNEALVIAANAMANIDISTSFKHKASIAYIVWLTPAGQKIKIEKNNLDFIEKSMDNRWLVFRNLVMKSLSEKGIRRWAEHLGWNDYLPKWEYFINSHNDTSIRGLQIGLARYLERRKEYWNEKGLVKNTDAALWRIPGNKRRIESFTMIDNPVCPQIFLSKDWGEPPEVIGSISNNSGSFFVPGMSEESTVKKEDKKDNAFLFWCTQKSLQTYGKKLLDKWFLWLIHKSKGLIIFDELDNPEQRFIFKHLTEGNIPYQRWIIEDEGKLKGVLWWINIYANPNPKKIIKWRNWTGKELKKKETVIIKEEDEFGRVPYRSLSQITLSQGMAPRRLEQNMFEGLQLIKKEFKNVDKWVSKGLDIPLEELASRLSAEQIDAVALGKKALSSKGGIIIADETGFGKGRILAALALTGLKAGKTVVLFTENAQLFSDFYRDILAVNGDEELVPTLLHQKAVVVDPNGKLITKSLSKKNFEIQLSTPGWEKGQARIILSTYSQINRAGEENPKVNWLLSRIGTEGWLLLDEAHNAAGDSNISKNLDYLIDHANGVIFSSATFAKTEKNLTFYKKALPVDDITYTFLKKSMAGDTGEIREALTTAMAKEGRFIRREHPPVPPPKPIWIDLTIEQDTIITNFSIAWQKIFEASEAWEKAQFGKSAMSWFKLGAALSRSIKDFSMLMKSDFLIDEIERKLKLNEKVVVVVESTFEAALKNAIEGETFNDAEEQEEETFIESEAEEKKSKKETGLQKLDSLPLWKTRLKVLLEKVSPQEELYSNNEVSVVAKKAYVAAIEAIDNLPDWDLAPLDKIVRELAKRGIPCGELSGRGTSITQKGDDWYFGSRETKDRISLVSDFNSGELNALILTRAGCSGISLHAGVKFKDQRIRNLIEWNIATNPANRIQFWGRVRRKDQVREPNFFGLALNILSERRNLAKEDLKREKLAAHVGMQQKSKTFNWLTIEGEELVAEWATDRFDVARRLGIARPVNDEPLGRVDRALARSIILEEEEQEGLLNRLERGLLLANDIAWRERHDPVDRESRVIRRRWWWGHFEKTEDNQSAIHGTLSMPRLDVVERIWEPKEKIDPNAVISYFKKIAQDPMYKYKNGDYVLGEWLSSWDEEYQIGIKETYTRKSVSRWIKEKLPLMKTGNAIRVSRPGSGDAVWGIIFYLDSPERDLPKLNSASPWSLSQVGIKVWLIGESEPLMIPLSRCFTDSQFFVNGQKAQLSWFEANPVVNVGISVEGNPVLAAAWGRRWNAGRPTLINDQERGLKWVWALPQSWKWSDMDALPRDLIDVEHAIKFWTENADGELQASLPGGKTIKGTVIQGGVSFQFDEKTYKEAVDTWLGFKQNKALSYIKKVGDNMLERHAEWKNLRTVLYAMESYGIVWRCEAKYLAWYKRTSKDRVNLFDKSLVTTTPKKKSLKKKNNK